MKGIQRFRSSGFSLLEVMIAVVVLATGLLALASLQGSLTRSSAEAKVRGRVAALLSARMDELRATGYSAVPVGNTTGNCTGADWVPNTFCQEAGIGAITGTQSVTLWGSVPKGTFATGFTPTSELDPQFKRVVLTGQWTAADASTHQLVMTSQLSDLTLKLNVFPSPPTQGTLIGGPVVREANPATAGVIPIALGNGDSSAASNPTPEILGSHNNQTITGTKFNVLTYTPGGALAQIQKRFENEVIKCTCQYGAAITANLSSLVPAQWPAVWNGDNYEVYTPDSATDAPGLATPAGPKSGVDQSPLCQECCRDHQDDGTANVAKFDPERTVDTGETTGHEKYNLNGSNSLVKVPNSSSATYIDSCRVIRVDGFWRTASDMYSRQYGLLETETVSSKTAKTGLPTAAATTAYTAYVKNYLKQYTGSVGTAPTGSQALYDGTTNINNPTSVYIATPSNSDYRYLHARGLYVDYLEKKARDKLVAVLADTGPQGRCPQATKDTTVEDCILPYLPFTTINVTELAKWLASNTNVLSVNSQNVLATNPTQPSGGRTAGVAVGTANNLSSLRKSNSGVAASSLIAIGVDSLDDTTLGNDSQPFQVGGLANTGDSFYVRMSGGGSNPYVFYSLTADTGECLKPSGGDYRCATNTMLTAANGSVQLSHYWAEGTQTKSFTVTASGAIGSTVCTQVANGKNAFDASDAGSYSVNNFPVFTNYSVSSASIGAGTGSITTAMPVTSTADNTASEASTIAFTGISANTRIDVGLTSQGTRTDATPASCTLTYSSSGKIWTLAVDSWNKPWIP